MAADQFFAQISGRPFGDDRATIYGALLWMADKLQSEDHEHARSLWSAKGKQAFEDN